MNRKDQNINKKMDNLPDNLEKINPSFTKNNLKSSYKNKILPIITISLICVTLIMGVLFLHFKSKISFLRTEIHKKILQRKQERIFTVENEKLKQEYLSKKDKKMRNISKYQSLFQATCEEDLENTLTDLKKVQADLKAEKVLSKKCKPSSIKVKYEVEDTNGKVQIFFNKFTNLAQGEYQVEIDGSVVTFDTPSHYYQFTAAGPHEAVITINKPLTTLSCFFYSCKNVTEVDFSNFVSDQVADISLLFFEAYKLKSIDFTDFDTSMVTDMGYIFNDCLSLETVNLKGFKTSKTLRMSGMFKNVKVMKELDLSSFDTSNVETMENMFFGMDGLTTINLSSFKTPKTVDMRWMFGYCSSLESLDLSGFDTSAVTDMNNMFTFMKKLKVLNIENFSFSDKTNVNHLFNNLTDTSDIKLIYNSAKQARIVDMIPANWVKEDVNVA